MNHFKLNFYLIYSKFFDLEEIENLIPWEKEIYTHLLMEQLQKEKEELEKQTGRHG